MPYRRRHAKSRRRRPKARRRVDKVQNRRLTRLENAVEKKFAYRDPAQFRALGEIASETSQIVALLPPSNQDASTEGRIGNQISLKNVRCDFTLESDAPMCVRVIFFWLTVPRTWTVPDPSGVPASTGVNPSWSQLLNAFVLEPGGTGTGTTAYNNIVAQHQLITDSNQSPIIRLSDRVHYLGSPQIDEVGDTTPMSSSQCIKKLSFSKSYKDMKLTYNDVTSAAAPVNRQLYMAVCYGTPTPVSGSPTCKIDYSVSMKYTDS